MPDAVLFEFEGVLAQTASIRQAALHDALAARGISPPACARDPRLGTLSARAAVDRIADRGGITLDETERELLAAEADREFALRAAGGLTLAAGARECVTRLHSTARLGLVSRAGRGEIESALALAGGGLEFAFECIIAREDVALPKPSPRGHSLALQRLSARRPVRAGAVVALEDAAAGILAARGAGLFAVAVGDVPPDEAMQADAFLPGLDAATVARLDDLLRSAQHAS